MTKPIQFTSPITIAIVGLSDKPERPSYQVAQYLLSQGFQIIPVNPNIESVFGLRSFSSLSAIPSSQQLDVVDVFRQPEQVFSVIDEIVNNQRHPVLWLQEGVGSSENNAYALERGITTVSNKCLMKEMVTPDTLSQVITALSTEGSKIEQFEVR